MIRLWAFLFTPLGIPFLLYHFCLCPVYFGLCLLPLSIRPPEVHGHPSCLRIHLLNCFPFWITCASLSTHTPVPLCSHVFPHMPATCVSTYLPAWLSAWLSTHLSIRLILFSLCIKFPSLHLLACVSVLRFSLPVLLLSAVTSGLLFNIYMEHMKDPMLLQWCSGQELYLTRFLCILSTVHSIGHWL